MEASSEQQIEQENREQEERLLARYERFLARVEDKQAAAILTAAVELEWHLGKLAWATFE